MTDTQLVGNLLILCGCLHDIAEKTKEYYTSKQCVDVQKRIEKVLVERFPEADFYINNQKT